MIFYSYETKRFNIFRSFFLKSPEFSISLLNLFQTLGQRLKGDFKTVMNALKSLDDEEILAHLAKGYFSIKKHRIELSEVRLVYCVSQNLTTNLEANSENDILVLLDVTPNAELLEEGLAREIINRIQKLKKKAKLIPTDEVVVFYRLNDTETSETNSATTNELTTVIRKYESMIVGAIKSKLLPYNDDEKSKRNFIITELVNVKGVDLELTICTAEIRGTAEVQRIKIMLADNLTPRFEGNRQTSLLLRHVETGEFITLTQLHNEVNINFGFYGVSYDVYWFDEMQQQIQVLKANDLNEKLNGKLLVVARSVSDVSREIFLAENKIK